MHFFPKNINFFQLFERQTAELAAANTILQSLDRSKDISETALKMHAVEEVADQVTHEIFRTLNQTFITPIDREDIVVLASRLDDIVDAIDRSLNRMSLYHIDGKSREIVQYAHLLDKIIREVMKAVPELQHGPKGQANILKHCEIINFIENEIDEHNRHTIGELVNGDHDPVKIIKLKEIYETLESVADRCEDVANALETIVIKNQ
jgi:uncharacterized protein